MKLLLALTCAGLTGVAAQQLLPCAVSSCEPAVDEAASHGEQAPHGLLVDARSASVFAGGCHANAEFSSQGESALLGWSLEGGSFDGVALGGVCVAAAVTSTANLREGAARSSVVYVDAGASDAQASAAERWLRTDHAATLGQVTAVRRAPVSLTLVGERFELEVDGRMTLEGERIADRSCCTMPESVWYEPLAEDASGAVVGRASECSFQGEPGFPAWSYRARNNTFVASFGAGPQS